MEITNFQEVLLFREEKASAGKFLPIPIYTYTSRFNTRLEYEILA